MIKFKLNDHRIKFFGGVIKEAFASGGPLARFAAANPKNMRDPKKLWEMRVVRQKDNKAIPLINLKSESDLADRNGLIKKSGNDPSQESFRNFVNKKLQSQGNKLNPLYKGFLDVMNEPDVKNTLADVLLTRVLKLGLLDELETWDKYEFGFYLTEGVGSVDRNLKPNVGQANVIDIHSIMIAIARLSKLDARKKWIISSLSSSAIISVDAGAAKALLNGKSLLAAGIIKVKGSFDKGENVLIVDQNEKQLARGLASFNSKEIDKIKGKQSKEIEKILGYLSKSEIIHKDDMVKL